MANRPSYSTGAYVAITILALLFAGASVWALISHGTARSVRKDLTDTNEQLKAIVLASEQNTDRINTMIQLAKGENKSLVRYLDDSLRFAMEYTIGNADAKPEDLQQAIEAAESLNGMPTLVAIRAQAQEIDRLKEALRLSDESRRDAGKALLTQTQRMTELQAAYDTSLQGAQDTLDSYATDVTVYRTDLNETVERNNERVARIRRQTALDSASQEGEIESLTEQNIVLRDTVQELKSERRSNALRGADERALADGRIAAVIPRTNEVLLDIGESQRVGVGMTFEVYGSAGAIRPDEEGEFPEGKASLEVIQVNEDSSRARVIRSNRRNPIVADDVIANAVYDPEKQYRFVVFGNFDTDGDGNATPAEANGVRRLIAGWGGVVEDDLTGQTDFVVLGVKPEPLPVPPPDAPISITYNYSESLRAASRYDEIFESAAKVSIPVLNQNRLYTLTGLNGAR